MTPRLCPTQPLPPECCDAPPSSGALLVMNARTETRDFLRYRDEGSSESLARVFDAVAPRLLLLAAHLTADASQAEDLVQTTFLHGMRDAARFDGKRPVAGWLAGILNHRALDLRRRSAIRAHETLSETETEGLDPAELAADQELLEHIIAEIDLIDSPYREVLSLRVVHGLKATSIAHTLGRSPGTVRMQLKRGLERLRAAMPEQSACLGVFLLEPSRGLDVIKEAVLAKAGTGVVAAATAAATSNGILGGFALMKLSVAAITILILSALAYNLSGQGEAHDQSVLGMEAKPMAAAVIEETDSPLQDVAPPRAEAKSALRESVAREAEPEFPAAFEGQVAVHVRYQSDGAPAADVGLYARSATGDELGVELRTDAQGRAKFMDLSEGQHLLHVDRFEEPVPFSSSRIAPLEIRIPAGVQVTGRVLDLEGNPVARANVMRFNPSHHDVMQVATVSDAEGRFVFRDVEDGTEFLARVDGFQPSEIKTVRANSSNPGELELVMGARGHHVKGRVVDADGNPVPHAWLAIGVDEDARDELRGSATQPALSERRKALDLEALLLRADADGRFESREVPAGYVLVIARSVDRNSDQIGSETLWVRYGTEEEVTIHLRRGAVIEGVLRDSNGRPVPDVEVEAEWEGTPALGQMEDDIGPLMSDRRCMSAKDGSYRLPGLLAGDYDLRISGKRKRLLKEERMIGEGEIVQWNPVLTPLAAMNVQLVDAQAEPLKGWIIATTDQPGSSPAWSFFGETTDQDGRRRLLDLDPEETYSITIYAPNPGGNFNLLPVATRDELRPREELITIALTSDETDFGNVSGYWLDLAGAPRRNQWLQLRCTGNSSSTSVQTDDDGRFAFKGVPAGEYRFTANGDDQGVEAFVVAPGQAFGAGEIRSSGPQW